MMKNLILRVLAFTAAIAVIGCLGKPSSTEAKNLSTPKAEMCFIPFAAETPVPLTKDNIAEHSKCIKVDADKKAVIALSGLLHHAEPAVKGSNDFQKYKIRLMFLKSPDHDPVFVSQDGSVMDAKKYAKLDHWQQAAVETILDYLSGCGGN